MTFGQLNITRPRLSRIYLCRLKCRPLSRLSISFGRKLGVPRFEAEPTGWEVWTLPLCYSTTPPERTHFKSLYFSQLLLELCRCLYCWSSGTGTTTKAWHPALEGSSYLTNTKNVSQDGKFLTSLASVCFLSPIRPIFNDPMKLRAVVVAQQYLSRDGEVVGSIPTWR